MRTKYQVTQSMQGKQKQTVDFSKFSDALEGHPMPEITPDAIGKFRLHTSLQSKFGKQYANHPTAQAMLAHFETAKTIANKMNNRG